MSKTLEGMARAICLAIWDHDYTPRDPLHPDARWLQAMKAAKAGAGFLADNVSDEMGEAFMQAWSRPWATHTEEELKRKPVVRALAAALRAAAESK